MILGIGTDIVEIKRIETLLARFEERFQERVFTHAEQEKCGSNPAAYAKRFAAKEAALKALGTGLRDIRWRDIETTSDPLGKPMLTLHGGALTRLQEITPENTTATLHLSLSDEAGMALAFVIIECQP